MSNEDSSGYGLNDMPPIRGNPQVARASQQRRLSVANPNPGMNIFTIFNLTV